MGRDDTTGKAIYAQEILVTRTDIEEQASAMREMQSKVDELHIHSEYQLRLKDMDANEKIKEVTEKFTQELEQDKNRYELLREEKNDMEMEFEEKIKHTEETHLHRLQQCEAEFQKQIMSEVERYQELVSAIKNKEKYYIERKKERKSCLHKTSLLADLYIFLEIYF